ncbi:MAG: hypothetical protein IIB09_09720, partial [Bacteroidetes bacterium]|nr:hypothetical protein [Bacteroidota bacterium]
GIIAALIALATIVGKSVVEWASRFCGKRTTLLLWAAGIQTAAIVCVGLVSSFPLAVAFYLLAMASMGVWGPVRQAYMHGSIPSEQRASVISFDSLITSSGSVVGQVGLARLAQLQSLAAGYVVGGITTVLVMPIVLSLRHSGENTDVIVGEAGKRGACAAQGIPRVASLDTDAPVPVPKG